jgi:hypothetical protein
MHGSRSSYHPMVSRPSVDGSVSEIDTSAGQGLDPSRGSIGLGEVTTRVSLSKVPHTTISSGTVELGLGTG